MTPDELRSVLAFERSLTPGAPVRVNWTNSGTQYSALGKVVRVNSKSIRVELTEGTSGGHKPGQTFAVPKFMDTDGWSARNCASPLEGYSPIPANGQAASQTTCTGCGRPGHGADDPACPKNRPPAEPRPTPKRPATAASLRAQADTTAEKAANLRGPRLENTPKRQYQGMAARCDARNLDRVVVALRLLADHYDAGTLPVEFDYLRTRKQVEPLVTRIIEHPSYYVASESDRWRDDTAPARALREFIDKAKTAARATAEAEQAKADSIRAMEERIRFSPIPGFFPTPPAVVEAMLRAAEIEPGMWVLEPSAGKGDIADAIAAKFSIQQLGKLRDPSRVVLQCIEHVPDLANICKAKGYETECTDFLEYLPPPRGFDRAIMNPPFERGQDVAHVLHALQCLKPGGRLVAIMSPSFTFAVSAQGFRDRLEKLGATVTDLEPGAFTGRDVFRETGVNAKLVIIDQPRD